MPTVIFDFSMFFLEKEILLSINLLSTGSAVSVRVALVGFPSLLFPKLLVFFHVHPRVLLVPVVSIFSLGP